MANENQKWKRIIKSKRKPFDLQFGEVWRYRDLIALFVKREFISKYKQTILGPLWAIIQPLLTTVVFSVVFGKIAGLPVTDSSESSILLPPFLFYMAGTIAWGYFSHVVSATSETFRANARIMSKVYFPRLVSPISTAISNLISYGIQILLFIIIYAVCAIVGIAEVNFTVNVLLVPLCILQMMLLGLGTGILISSLTTKYRDLAMLVGFGLQLWEYASPVAYGLSLVTEHASAAAFNAYMINPFTSIVTTIRYGVFGSGYFNITFYLISWGVTLLLFFAGVLLFNRVEKTFTDTI